MSAQQALLEVKHLKKYYKVDRNRSVKALDDISFQIFEGETLGMVGETGCGKSTCGRVSVGLYSKTSGDILYRGRSLDKMSRREKKDFRHRAQVIFQDPYSSLDPRMTVADIIAEGIEIHGLAANRQERNQCVYQYLKLVGLGEEHANRFVHEFSGGQRQRIGIARALAVEPEFLVLDEPISALDVSIQAQIVNLLVRLQKEKKLTYLFIAHDLSMVRHISDRIIVMYLGKVMEVASSEELYRHPLHPYTRSLIEAIPIPDPEIELERQKNRQGLFGEIPSPANPPIGCRFCTRCPLATSRCMREAPELRQVGEGHCVACHACESGDIRHEEIRMEK